MIILLMIATTNSACSQEPSDVPGVTRNLYNRVCGVWEEPRLSEASGRIMRQFSWGTGGVIPNQGLIIELGKPQAYIRYIGEVLSVNSLEATDDAVEITVADTVISGPGAFVKVLMTLFADGTALVDFQYADGTYFGAILYKRLFGPEMDQ